MQQWEMLTSHLESLLSLNKCYSNIEQIHISITLRRDEAHMPTCGLWPWFGLQSNQWPMPYSAKLYMCSQFLQITIFHKLREISHKNPAEKLWVMIAFKVSSECPSQLRLQAEVPHGFHHSLSSSPLRYPSLCSRYLG